MFRTDAHSVPRGRRVESNRAVFSAVFDLISGSAIVLSVTATAILAIRWKWIDCYFGGVLIIVLRQGMQKSGVAMFF